jgi:hypothetical protein
MSEAELDRDAAEFLFRQAVGIGTGEGPDQGRLAVVDVARGAEDEVA